MEGKKLGLSWQNKWTDTKEVSGNNFLKYGIFQNGKFIMKWNII